MTGIYIIARGLFSEKYFFSKRIYTKKIKQTLTTISLFCFLMHIVVSESNNFFWGL